jgi:HEPN domain-containing protein
MVLSEPEGLLKIAIADLETAEASSDPAVFREGARGFWLQQAVEKALKASPRLPSGTRPMRIQR